MPAHLITPSELREHISTDLSDEAVTRIIASEEAEIVRRFGAHTHQVDTFYLDGEQEYIMVRRSVKAVTSVTETITTYMGNETTTVLADDDWELVNPFILARRSGGTNSRYKWGDIVRVEYLPTDENLQRQMVLINLCKLAITFSGYQSYRTPEITVEQRNYFNERERTLKMLKRNLVIA